MRHPSDMWKVEVRAVRWEAGTHRISTWHKTHGEPDVTAETCVAPVEYPNGKMIHRVLITARGKSHGQDVVAWWGRAWWIRVEENQNMAPE